KIPITPNFLIRPGKPFHCFTSRLPKKRKKIVKNEKIPALADPGKPVSKAKPYSGCCFSVRERGVRACPSSHRSETRSRDDPRGSSSRNTVPAGDVFSTATSP